MTAKEEAKKLKSIFLKQLLTATPALDRPHYQSKEIAKIHIDLMIEKMNNYSDLESHLYQNGYGNTTIVAEIICLENIKKELELL